MRQKQHTWSENINSGSCYGTLMLALEIVRLSFLLCYSAMLSKHFACVVFSQANLLFRCYGWLGKVIQRYKSSCFTCRLSVCMLNARVKVNNKHNAATKLDPGGQPHWKEHNHMNCFSADTCATMHWQDCDIFHSTLQSGHHFELACTEMHLKYKTQTNPSGEVYSEKVSQVGW